MGSQVTQADFFKTNALTGSGNAVAVGASTLIMSGVSFTGYKAQGVANTGSVWVRLAGGNGVAIEIVPGAIVPWSITASTGGWMRASQFEMWVATANDGVGVIYSRSIFHEGV